MGTLSRTVRRRASKQFGESLDATHAAGGGIGPGLRLDLDAVPPILFPTQTFRSRAELVIGGVQLDLEAAPGETRDHLFVHLPAERTVLAGDNIYRAFPNLHAIRGAPPRPVRFWIQSLDKIRALNPHRMVLGHTEPVSGADAVQEILTAYRDAMAYLARQPSCDSRMRVVRPTNWPRPSNCPNTYAVTRIYWKNMEK